MKTILSKAIMLLSVIVTIAFSNEKLATPRRGFQNDDRFITSILTRVITSIQRGNPIVSGFAFSQDASSNIECREIFRGKDFSNISMAITSSQIYDKQATIICELRPNASEKGRIDSIKLRKVGPAWLIYSSNILLPVWKQELKAHSKSSGIKIDGKQPISMYRAAITYSQNILVPVNVPGTLQHTVTQSDAQAWMNGNSVFYNPVSIQNAWNSTTDNDLVSFYLDQRWNRIVTGSHIDNSVIGFNDEHLVYPSSMCVSPLYELFVAVPSSNQIVKYQFDYTTKSISFVQTISLPGIFPQDIYYDKGYSDDVISDDVIWIADPLNDQIVKLDRQGTVIQRIVRFSDALGGSYQVYMPRKIIVPAIGWYTGEVAFISGDNNFITITTKFPPFPTPSDAYPRLVSLVTFDPGSYLTSIGLETPISHSEDGGYLITDRGLHCVHKVFQDYVGSYKSTNPAYQFGWPRNIASPSFRVDDGRLWFHLGVYDNWSPTEGLQEFYPGADIMNPSVQRVGSNIEFRWTATNWCTNSQKVILPNGNEMILQNPINPGWVSPGPVVISRPSSDFPPGSLRFKISVLPYYNSDYIDPHGQHDYRQPALEREVQFNNTLSAPTNLNLTSRLGTIRLTWDPVPGAAYYAIYRNNVKLDNSSSPNYDDQIPAAGQSYAYFVKPACGNVEGPASSTVVGQALHLVSTSPTATGPNNQRKVIAIKRSFPLKDAYFLVYESDGDIYETTSTDAGLTWSSETLISFGTGGCTSPSIAGWYDPSLTKSRAGTRERKAMGKPRMDYPKMSLGFPYYLFVVFQQQTELNTNIYCSEFEEDHWNGPVLVNEEWPMNSQDNSHPVVSCTTVGGDIRATVLWDTQDPYDDALGIQRREWDSEQGWDQSPTNVFPSGGWGLTRNPSISVGPSQDNGNSSTDVFFTFNDGLFVNLAQNEYQPISSRVPYFGYTPVCAQISYDNYNNLAGVACEAIMDLDQNGSSPFSGTLHEHVIWYGGGDPSYSGTTLPWNALHMFYNGSGDLNFYHPTITQLSSGKTLMAWDDGHSTYHATNSGSGWTIDGVFPNAVNPNFVYQAAGAALLDNSVILATGTSGSPYSLNVLGSGNGQVIEEEDSRAVQATGNADSAGNGDKNKLWGSFSLNVSKIKIKMRDGSTMKLKFTDNDSIPHVQPDSLWCRLATAPVTLTSPIDSVIIIGTTRSVRSERVRSEKNVRISFELVDAVSGKVLRKVGAETTIDADSTLPFVVRDQLRGLSGRQVFIRPTVGGLKKSNQNLSYALVHIHKVQTDSTFSPLLRAGTVLKPIPTEYRLHQNFPNPFNPSTTIDFDLPEAAKVSIAVFDVLGRKVTELVNGTQDIGYHSVTWNASNVSSGVYFARFTATDANGSVKLSKVSKLLLTK